MKRSRRLEFLNARDDPFFLEVAMIVLEPGAIFQGRYRLIVELGSGTFSQVWQAEQTMLLRQYAIKVMRENLRNPRLVARFRSEAQLLAAMDHPNVIKVVDADMVDGRPYFIMQYHPSRDLLRVMEEDGVSGRLAPLRIVEILSGAMQGLIAAHTMGVVHRDVKPANILVGDDGVVRVIDFGIALILDDDRKTRDGEAVGTPAYMAPEQKLGRLLDGPACDVFALGVTLFEMCGGDIDGIDLSRPEEREPRLASLQMQYQPFLTVIRRATELEPESRYGSVDEMLAALGAARRKIEQAAVASGGLPSLARRPTPPAPTAIPPVEEPPRPPPAHRASEEDGGSRMILPAPAPLAAPPSESDRSDPFMTQVRERRPFPTAYVVGFIVVLAVLIAVGTFVSGFPAKGSLVQENSVTTSPEVEMETPEMETSPVPVVAASDAKDATIPTTPATPVVVPQKSVPEKASVAPSLQKKAEPPAPAPVVPSAPPVVDPPPPVVSPPVSAPPAPAVFSHTPVATCGSRIEAKAPAGSTVQIRVRPVSTGIWQDPKSLREESEALVVMVACTGDLAAGYDYYLKANLPDGSKARSGSASVPHQVRP